MVSYPVLILVACLSFIQETMPTLAPMVVANQLLFEGGKAGEVAAYRIPAAKKLPNGDIIAIAEARKFSGSDSGAKFLPMRRSSDGGMTWSPMTVLVDDYLSNDGLTIGSIIVDETDSALIILYSYCIHETCPGKNNDSFVYMLKSKNWGSTWDKPVDISIKNPKLKGFSWAGGPGYGMQKTLPPMKGRLIACGQLITPYAVEHGVKEGLYCLISDDHGVTWKNGASVPGIPDNVEKKTGDFAPSEAQMVELSNGSLLCFTRNTYHYHCSCKVVSRSDDGGNTFRYDSIYFDETLVDPSCAGSALLHDGILYHLNPSSPSKRVNLTLRWSEDEGANWKGALIVDPGASGYSCLTEVDGNNIGLVYESTGYSLKFVKVRLHP